MAMCGYGIKNAATRWFGLDDERGEGFLTLITRGIYNQEWPDSMQVRDQLRLPRKRGCDHYVRRGDACAGAHPHGTGLRKCSQTMCGKARNADEYSDATGVVVDPLQCMSKTCAEVQCSQCGTLYLWLSAVLTCLSAYVG